jgi:hypothetical protein
VIPQSAECNCFVKYNAQTLDGSQKLFFDSWAWFYGLSLSYTVILLISRIARKIGDYRNMALLLAGYISFFPASFLIIDVQNSDINMVASVMCSLAVLTAVVVGHMSLHGERAQQESPSDNDTRNQLRA